MSRIRLAVDNERNYPAATPPAEEPSGRPLPWAVCLLIWGGAAAAGWAAVILALHFI